MMEKVWYYEKRNLQIGIFEEIDIK